MSHRGSSRKRYAEFVQKYKRHQLDDPVGVEGRRRRVRAARARQAPRVSSRLPALALAASLRDRDGLRARAPQRRARDGRTAVHAVHRRPGPPQLLAGPGDATLVSPPDRRHLRRRGHPLQPGAGPQGLPSATAERPGHALAPAVALRPAAPPAAAETLGHENRRHPVAPHRRRRDDDGPSADGGHLAVGLVRPADHRGDHPPRC